MIINKQCYKDIASYKDIARKFPLQLAKTSLLLLSNSFSLSIEASAFTAECNGTNKNGLLCV